VAVGDALPPEAVITPVVFGFSYEAHNVTSHKFNNFKIAADP